MNINKAKYIITILICAAIAVFFSSGLEQQQPVEEINIISALGEDLEINGNTVKYITSFSSYLFGPQEKIENVLKTGTGSSIAQTRQTRQLIDDKQSTLGLEKIFVMSQETALYGIRSMIDIQFRNPNLNATAYSMVCKGKALDILGMNIKGYPSSADYIDGLIKNSVYYNFFSNDYKVLDMFFAIDSEGRNLVLPYIEMTDKGIGITGMALFNKDKMVAKIDIDQLKVMNLMRENNVHGILSLQTTPKNFISYYATSKRKISCTREGDKYKFTINIDLSGDIINDSLYKDIQKDPEKNDEFNKAMATQVKNNCNNFIIKMKNQYKVDCIQLGQIAVAKYGRQTGVDWDSIVCNSEIDVNVKVKVIKTGRADY